MNKNAENAEEFFCKECDFRCCKLSNWKTHTLTRKHQNRTQMNEKMPKNATASYACKKCNKTYKARNSLWYHESKCTVVETNIDRILNDNQRLLNDNIELRNFIVEQSKLTADLMTRTMDKVINKALESNKNT
jgi:hypothetical protein